MIQTINLSQFRDEFNAIRPNNFSYEGLELIYDFLEELDEGNFELDVIAICCDFSEGDFQEVANELDEDLIEETQGLDEGETAQLVAKKLEDKTFVLGVTSDNSIVYQNF